MPTAAPKHHYSFAEYLEFEESSNTKHEFSDGEIYGMAGGSPEHAAITVAMAAQLYNALGGGPCKAYSSDLRVRVAATGLTTYPDVTVVCDPVETDPESPTTVTNPKIVVEVLSPSTEDYDRGEKLDHYQQVPSMEACVLVDPKTRTVERWLREEGQWKRQSFASHSTMPLPGVPGGIVIDALF
ncbi:MAG: Uma2 family endonuclease [Deltaproteobacteria bacterium]|nr:MAG: Uma2 family endonuclease [Deltaproteobacteria bacterium]